MPFVPTHRPKSLFQEFQTADNRRLFCLTAADTEETNDVDNVKHSISDNTNKRDKNRPAKKCGLWDPSAGVPPMSAVLRTVRRSVPDHHMLNGNSDKLS